MPPWGGGVVLSFPPEFNSLGDSEGVRSGYTARGEPGRHWIATNNRLLVLVFY